MKEIKVSKDIKEESKHNMQTPHQTLLALLSDIFSNFSLLSAEWWWWLLLIITLRRILWLLDSRSLCPKNPDPSKSSRIDGHNPIPGSWHYRGNPFVRTYLDPWGWIECFPLKYHRHWWISWKLTNLPFRSLKKISFWISSKIWQGSLHATPFKWITKAANVW